MNEKKRILTGLQPTGVITLGNYIGAIKQMQARQDMYDSIIFVADMHAITVAQDPKELHKNTISLVALYLACGIDPWKNHIFIQSQNVYHANISWMLECNSYYGELSRMTQFKDKSQKNANFTSGLLTYPVLMAADILAYDADYVPVGGDQKQHVELARDIAERFNKKYGKTFTVPEPLISKEGTKIYDLQDPTKKMSKSAENQKGVIRLLDELDVVRKKIMSATTDSETNVKYDPENKPGISNLINIYVSLTGKTIKETENEFMGASYGVFKEAVANVVCRELEHIQERYHNILRNGEVEHILRKGLEYVEPIAKEKYYDMKKKIGFVKENDFFDFSDIDESFRNGLGKY